MKYLKDFPDDFPRDFKPSCKTFIFVKPIKKGRDYFETYVPPQSPNKSTADTPSTTEDIEYSEIAPSPQKMHDKKNEEGEGTTDIIPYQQEAIEQVRYACLRRLETTAGQNSTSNRKETASKTFEGQKGLSQKIHGSLINRETGPRSSGHHAQSVRRQRQEKDEPEIPPSLQRKSKRFLSMEEQQRVFEKVYGPLIGKGQEKRPPGLYDIFLASSEKEKKNKMSGKEFEAKGRKLAFSTAIEEEETSDFALVRPLNLVAFDQIHIPAKQGEVPVSMTKRDQGSTSERGCKMNENERMNLSPKLQGPLKAEPTRQPLTFYDKYLTGSVWVAIEKQRKEEKERAERKFSDDKVARSSSYDKTTTEVDKDVNIDKEKNREATEQPQKKSKGRPWPWKRKKIKNKEELSEKTDVKETAEVTSVEKLVKDSEDPANSYKSESADQRQTETEPSVKGDPEMEKQKKKKKRLVLKKKLGMLMEYIKKGENH